MWLLMLWFYGVSVELLNDVIGEIKKLLIILYFLLIFLQVLLHFTVDLSQLCLLFRLFIVFLCLLYSKSH